MIAWWLACAAPATDTAAPNDSPVDSPVADTAGACEDPAWFPDEDGDGFGDADHPGACEATAGWVEDATDCDDGDAWVHPDGTETCDLVDEDCDGEIDEDGVDAPSWYPDDDGDGYGRDEATVACSRPEGFTTAGGDCDDEEPAAHPDGEEVCNDRIDNDCDGTVNGCLMPTGHVLGGDVTLHGPHDGAWAGRMLAGPGDVDGDGRDDIAVGAYADDTAETGAGAVYVVSGPGTGLETVLEAEGIRYGEAAGDVAGRVAGPGDLDGDGFAELLVGAPSHDGGGTDAGAAYVLFGPITGTDSLSAADVRIDGESEGAWVGGTVAAGRDMDGDGVTDLVLSGAGEEDRGTIYLFSGVSRGDHLVASDALEVRGTVDDGSAGDTLALVEDADGDGHDELLVGAPDAGQAYLVRGPVTADVLLRDADVTFEGGGRSALGNAVAGVGDQDGDGYAELAVLGRSGRTLYLWRGGLDTGVLPRQSADVVVEGFENTVDGQLLCSPGDVDEDGLDDVLVGAHDADTHDQDTGAAYLFLGPLDGGVLVADDAALVLAGAAEDDDAGFVAPVGDVDGDDYVDLMVGAFSASAHDEEAGAVYLLRGTGL